MDINKLLLRDMQSCTASSRASRASQTSSSSSFLQANRICKLSLIVLKPVGLATCASSPPLPQRALHVSAYTLPAFPFSICIYPFHWSSHCPGHAATQHLLRCRSTTWGIWSNPFEAPASMHTQPTGCCNPRALPRAALDAISSLTQLSVTDRHVATVSRLQRKVAALSSRMAAVEGRLMVVQVRRLVLHGGYHQL